jgi:hypothetical protein
LHLSLLQGNGSAGNFKMHFGCAYFRAGISCKITRVLASYCHLTLLAASAQILNQTGHQGSPTGLMTCAEPLACFSVEIFMKQDEVFPIRIVLEPRPRPISGTLAGLIGQEEPRQAPADFLGDLFKIQIVTRTSGTLNL